jgi:TolA-binding protein
MRRTLIAAIILSATASSASFAQNVVDLRVDKLEKEMRAVQRKVFGATGVTVDPEMGSGGTSNTGTGSAGPMADLTARVDALESQLKTLTGQMEQDQNRMRKLDDALKALKADTDGRLRALEGGSTPGTAATPSTTPSAAPTSSKPASAPTPIASTPKPVATPIVSRTPITPPKPAVATKTVAVKTDPSRKSLVGKIELPDTGDAIEDAYTYGFGLWDEKLYPEAQVKLKEFVGKYSKHKRASYAQNLLGRAYLDEGKPALASVAFYENYTKNPRGDRAPDSLYYLGVSLTKLKKLSDACKVFDEFGDVYGATSSADLKARVAKGRADAKCTA